MFTLHGYGPSIFEGTVLTLEVSLASLLIAMLLGICGALAKLSRARSLRLIAQIYTTIIRGIPDLVLMLLVFYGGQMFINQLGPMLGYDGYIDINPFIAGVSTIGFIFGAYMTETVRAGIQSIKIGQTEAAKALGMTGAQTMRRVIFPQALRVIIPPVSNEFIAMVKDSSLVSLMGVWELSFRAVKIGRRYFQSLEMLILVAVIYWVMCIILQTIQEKIEKHMARGERGEHG